MLTVNKVTEIFYLIDEITKRFRVIWVTQADLHGSFYSMFHP
jgi:hypothetical protein